jgi:hypothetical protein
MYFSTLASHEVENSVRVFGSVLPMIPSTVLKVKNDKGSALGRVKATGWASTVTDLSASLDLLA